MKLRRNEIFIRFSLLNLNQEPGVSLKQNFDLGNFSCYM